MTRLTARKSILETKATKLRTEWGFGQTEPIQLKALLLRLNVLTLFRPMSDNFSGMALKKEESGEIFRFMMVNSNKSMGHQNFTICHELYHLYVQTEFVSQICKVGIFDKKDSEEYNADIFASYFLLPKSALDTNIPEAEIIRGTITLPTILRIEQMFNCSRRALLVRLKDLNLISESQEESFTRSIKANAVSYGYSPYLYEGSPAESVVGNYGELAHQLYGQEKISESHYYSLMTALGSEIDSVELLDDEISQ